MLRIIGGKYRRRQLKIPSSTTTRPTMDKIREAVFSSLNFDIANSVFLDLFAGSGAVGLEALSRGSSKVYMNELDRNVYKILLDNVRAIDEEKKVILSKMDYVQCLNSMKNNGVMLDIVYLDPPYRMKITKDILHYLHENNMLNPSALVILEALEVPEEIEGFELKTYKYGSKYIGKYRLNKE